MTREEAIKHIITYAYYDDGKMHRNKMSNASWIQS